MKMAEQHHLQVELTEVDILRDETQDLARDPGWPKSRQESTMSSWSLLLAPPTRELDVQICEGRHPFAQNNIQLDFLG